MTINPYLVSLGIGLLVGVLYALLGTRSPAPPVIALLGLLGMLIGETAVTWAKEKLTVGEAAAHCLEGKSFALASRADGSVGTQTGEHGDV